MRRISQIEDRLDVGGIEHRIVRRFDFLDARPNELDDRMLVEPSPFDIHRHPAAVAALVCRDVGDRQRQEIDQQFRGGIRTRLILAANQDVIRARLRLRNDCGLIRAQRILIHRIELIAVRHIAIAHEHFVRCVAVRAEHAHAQRLLGRHHHAIHLEFAGA